MTPEPSGNPPAIILGGTANAVSVARSLDAAAIPVHALGDGGLGPVRYSRHCRSYIRFEKGAGLQDSWLLWLQSNRKIFGGAVLLPCNDEALELIARRRATLCELGYLPFEADDEVLVAMLDKSTTYELARKVDVPAPQTLLVETDDSIDEVALRIGFPCGLKPLNSHLLQRQAGWPKVIVVNDPAELASTRERLRVLGVDVLASEIIPGADDQYVSYYSYLDESGKPLLHFTKRKIRQRPPAFGLATYHVTEWDPEAADLGLRFFQGVGVRGLANVEFKRDARDGRLKIIECNHRFTAANEIVRRAGLDLALLTYNRALGRPGPPMGSFREGLHLWDPVDDTLAFLTLHGRGELALRPWVRSLLHRQTLPLLSWDDPKPALLHAVRRAWLVTRRLRPGARLPASSYHGR